MSVCILIATIIQVIGIWCVMKTKLVLKYVIIPKRLDNTNAVLANELKFTAQVFINRLETSCQVSTF